MFWSTQTNKIQTRITNLHTKLYGFLFYEHNMIPIHKTSPSNQGLLNFKHKLIGSGQLPSDNKLGGEQKIFLEGGFFCFLFLTDKGFFYFLLIQLQLI